MRPSASLSSLECRPVSSVKTFRSTLPGRYGHGLGFVTKNFGKRNGALTRRPHALVTQTFMRLVNAEEKSWIESISSEGARCPGEGQDFLPASVARGEVSDRVAGLTQGPCRCGRPLHH